MAKMVADVGYALRALRRNPGFTVVVVLTLGLGIGVNTAIYSVIHGVFIQALPYEGGDAALVQLRQPAAAEGETDIGFSVQEIEDYRARSTTLTQLAEHHQLYFNLVGLGEPIRVFSGVVSANFFETLGVEPLHGRLFLPEDDRHDADPVIVLTHDFWMSQMGGDPEAVGRTLEMNGLIHTVVGILPPVPLYPEGAHIYITNSACPFRSSDNWKNNRTLRAMSVFGRLDEGAEVERLNAELQTVARAIRAEHAEAYPENRRLSAGAVPLRDALVEDARSTFLILLGTAMLVLLIATANVANLTFARLVRREEELGVREALGASRTRITRLLLTEAAILGSLGGALGLLLALSGVSLLTDLASAYTARASEIGMSTPVLVFTLVVALGAGIGSGLVPIVLGAGRSGRRLGRGGGRATAEATKRRLQEGLVVTQVGVSFLVLMAAGLTIRSLRELYAVDPGFDTSEILSMEIPAAFNRPVIESQRFYLDLLSEVRGLPGVEAASVVMTFPLDGWGQMAAPIQVEGREPDPSNPPLQADIRTTTTGYFETMGVPVVAGRAFTEEDQFENAPVAVVNQTLARQVFGDADPMGRRISWNGGNTWLTIVGVAADVKHYGMGEETEPEIYQAALMGMNSLLVRSASDPRSLLRPIKEIVTSLDPGQPVANVSTMGDRRAESLSEERLITSLLGLFAGLAALITGVGIGGVIAFTVSQRARELAIRIALGSTRGAVVSMLLRRGLLVTTVGLTFGGGGALLLSRYVQSILFNVETTDPATWIVVAGAFLGITAVAVLLPARRVAALDPRAVLTTE